MLNRKCQRDQRHPYSCYLLAPYNQNPQYPPSPPGNFQQVTRYIALFFEDFEPDHAFDTAHKLSVNGEGLFKLSESDFPNYMEYKANYRSLRFEVHITEEHVVIL